MYVIMIIDIWNSRWTSSLIDIPNNNLKLQIIAYDRRRGGTIVIDKRPGGRTVTSLIISQADVTDSGNYTCDPASNYSKWVIVHVTTGLYLVGYIYKNIHTKTYVLVSYIIIYIFSTLGSDNLAMRPGPVVGSAASFRFTPTKYSIKLWFSTITFSNSCAVFIYFIVSIAILDLHSV